MSQNEAILEYLQAGNTITPLEALDKFGCFRLGSRINDLRKQGIDIVTQMVDRGGKKFAKYTLIQEKEAVCA